MKIALFENLTSGGSKREAHEFAKQFVRAGHTVDLFAPSTSEKDFLPFNGVAQRHEYPLDLVGDRPLRLPGLTRYFGLCATLMNLSRLKRLGRTMADAIDEGSYDFVFAHHDRVVQGPYLLRYLKTKSVYFCAEPMRRFYEPHIPRPYERPLSLLGQAQRGWYTPARAVESNILKRTDRRNVRHATLLMTNSCFSAESIYRAYGLPSRIVYLGVDAEKFSPATHVREDFVLSVGAVSPLKGYDFLVHSLGKVPLKARPRLVIIGNTASGAERCYLESLAKDQGVRLEILVNVGEEQLVDLYRRAKLFVYAPVLEPFGLAPLEAMACETPVVGVREGGVRESVRDGETGILVDRSPPEFAEAVAQLLANDPLRRRMGQAGRERVVGYWTWEHAWGRFQTALTHFLQDENSGSPSES